MRGKQPAAGATSWDGTSGGGSGGGGYVLVKITILEVISYLLKQIIHDFHHVYTFEGSSLCYIKKWKINK